MSADLNGWNPILEQLATTEYFHIKPEKSHLELANSQDRFEVGFRTTALDHLLVGAAAGTPSRPTPPPLTKVYIFQNAEFESESAESSIGGELLAQWKDKKSNTFIDIKLLRVQRSTTHHGCNMVLVVEFVADIMKNMRFKSATIRCSLFRGDGQVLKVLSYGPELGFADIDGKTEGNTFSLTPGQAPITGTSASYSYQSSMTNKECLKLTGLCERKPDREVLHFDIKENPTTKHGIFRRVPIYVLLDSIEPFRLEIELQPQLAGDKWWKLGTGGSQSTYNSGFSIDPGTWETPKKQDDGPYHFFMRLASEFLFGWAWKTTAGA